MDTCVLRLQDSGFFRRGLLPEGGSGPDGVAVADLLCKYALLQFKFKEGNLTHDEQAFFGLRGKKGLSYTDQKEAYLGFLFSSETPKATDKRLRIGEERKAFHKVG